MTYEKRHNPSKRPKCSECQYLTKAIEWCRLLMIRAPGRCIDFRVGIHHQIDIEKPMSDGNRWNQAGKSDLLRQG